jgi:hypothetical protein
VLLRVSLPEAFMVADPCQSYRSVERAPVAHL